MSERPAVRLAGAGKMYRLFPSRTERLLDAFGLAGRLPFHRPRSTEFWALRGIDLELPAGRRIGVIGRNGAGKSTMLKLISGHLEPTEGVVEVDGTVDSLSEPGGGFHPDFTGAENVRMALTLRGLSREQIEEALAEIAEFTELGDFLARPFGTYSSGMKARLAFAASTSLLAPRVLLVDEVLGAGDAYFISKSAERMASVVASGATIIVVSHALDQVTRICEEVLWLDRGHLVARGPCLEVVKAYQQFMNVLDDRRLRDRNRRAVSSDAPRELRGRISVEGPEGAAADIAEVTLVVGERREPVRVGEAQDTVPDHDGRVVAEGGAWSDARSDAEGCWRTIPAGGAGLVAFRLDAEDARRDHALEVRYRLSGAARASLQAETERDTVARGDLAAGEGWRRQRLPLGPLAGEASRLTTGYQVSGEKPVSRWVGGGALRIAGVRLLGGDGRERAVFEAGTPLTLEVTAQARDAGEVDWLPAAVLYRREDGLLVARYIGETARGSFAAGGTCRANLVLDPVRLGNGHYVLSVGLYGTLDLRGLEPPLVHDLVDRSYEFAVVGTPPLRDGVFLPSEQWQLEAP